MAGFDRFDKRWASNGQLEAISDNNANLGLAFLGDDPPTSELHNQMFQWLDEKDNFLFDQLQRAITDRTGETLSATDPATLSRAINEVASATNVGIQRNSTGPETTALVLDNVSVTPASLKPLIDAINMAITNATPAGAVLAFAMSSAPTGWAICDGASYSRSTQSRLFQAIGITYGSADSNSFNVPDMRGRFARAWNNATTGVDANRVFGSLQTCANLSHSHTITVSSVPSHTHTFTSALAGGHTHSVGTIANGFQAGYSATAATAGVHNHVASSGLQSSDHTHSGNTNSAGDHQHSTYGPYTSNGLGHDGTQEADYGVPVSYNTVTGTGGSHTHAFVTAGMSSSHNHAITVNNDGGHTHTVAIQAIPDHTHNVTITAAADHSHTGTTDNSAALAMSGSAAATGGTESVPYNIALLYCIKL